MGGIGSKKRRGKQGIWHISYYARDPITGRAVRHWESTKSTSEKYANQVLLKRLQGERNRITKDNERLTMRDLADEMLRDYRINNRKSLKNVETRIDKHVIPFFARIRAIDIDTSAIRRYIDSRLDEGAANATINRELAWIRHMFRLSAEKLKRQAPAITLLEENNVRQGFVDYGDFRKLHAELPAWLKGPVSFLYLSGWRLHSVLTLERRDVDLDGGVIRLRRERSKNRETATFPLLGETRDIVEAAMKDARLECPYMFHRKGKLIKHPYASWRKACDAVGLHGLLFHDLCRSAIRNLDRAGVSDKVKMQWAGRKTRSIIDRYNIVHENDLRDAGEKLQTFLASKADESKVEKFPNNGLKR